MISLLGNGPEGTRNEPIIESRFIFRTTVLTGSLREITLHVLEDFKSILS